MRTELDKGNLGHGPAALEIGVKGFRCDPTGVDPTQVLIEIYDGKLQVHIWDGSSQDAQSTVIQPANT